MDTEENEEKISLLPYDISNANNDLLKISKENKNVKKTYTPIKSYKPEGNLVYDDDLISKLGNKIT